MHKKVLSGLVIIAAFMTLAGCGNKEDLTRLQIAPILAYSGDKEENIKFIRTKNYEGITVKEYEDTLYTYEVTPEGKLMTVFIKSSPKGTNPLQATVEEITLKTEDNLKRLGYEAQSFMTTVNFDEGKKQYQSTSRHKQGEDFTGNNIYIQYTSEGTLISISFKYEDAEILKTENKITVDEAKDILINYFKTNASTEKYAALLDKEMIQSEIDIYNNKKVYNLYFTLQAEEFGTYNFKYVISTESGIILYRKELR